jgi:hypothetical protein
MKIAIIILITSLILLIVYFRKDLKQFSGELLLPDMNPELITYLQGDWAMSEDAKSVVRIKRDSIIEIRNDTVRGVNTLRYLFKEAASKYFTIDSSFVFTSPDKDSLSTYGFRLREINNKSMDTVWHTLISISRSKLDMISGGRTISYNRVK